MDKIRPILWVLVFPACWYIFAHHVTVLTMLNDPVGLVSSLFIVVVAVDFFTLPFQNKRTTDNTSETKPKQTTDPAPYRMPRSKELNDLLLVYNAKRPNGMTVTELNSLYALTAQSGEKVDETISKIHREVKYERDRRKNVTPQPLGSSAEKGYAPAHPNAELNRAALDTTPEKVKKAQRKAGLRCPSATPPTSRSSITRRSQPALGRRSLAPNCSALRAWWSVPRWAGRESASTFATTAASGTR